MKIRIPLCFIFLIHSAFLQSQVLIESTDSISIYNILQNIKGQSDVSFSYNSGILDDKKILVQKGSYSLNKIVKLISEQLNHKFEFIDSRNVLIIPPEELNGKLNSICGYIKDRRTQNVLSFVNVYTPDNLYGTSTNVEGYFEFEIPSSYSSIIASFVGYDALDISLIEINQGCQTHFLTEDSELLSTIVLREYLDDGISQAENTKSIILNPDKMNVLPGLVDNDVFASLLILPGINSPSESLDGIFMRGGTPDQNLVLWDDIPVYHTSHLFGSISSFNPFMIDQVDVYRSAIGSEFGGRVSGVVDIKSKSTVPDKAHVGMGVNMTHAHFDFETPLWKNSALFISYRRSISDLWASPTFLNYADRIFQGSKVDPSRFANSDLSFNDLFAFNDGNFKWVYNLRKDKFEISSFGALNKLNYSTELPNVNALIVDKLDLNNSGLKVSWSRKWSDELTSDLIITNADFRYDYEILLEFQELMIESPNRGFASNRIQDGGFQLMFDWQPKKYQKFKFGFQNTENKIDFEIGRREPGVMEMEKQNFLHRLNSLVGEYSLELPDIVNMDVGLRLQNSPVLEKRFFEPRISIVTRLNEFMRLKASTSKQFQFVSQLVAFDTNDLGFGNEIWVASDENLIPVIESNQWVGGIIIEKDDWTLDIEGYVKELVGITSFSALSELPAPYAQGKSKLRGVDVLLKRRFKNFRSWISYTLSEFIYEFPSIPPGSFPAPQDQQQILQWINIYKKGPWEFSLGANMRSGLPFRDADRVMLVENSMGELVPRIQYGELNASRLKPYFRVDGSVIYNFKNTPGSEGYIGFSLQNITNHKNILGREFFQGEVDENSGLPRILPSNEFGLAFTPNVSVNIRW